MLKILAPYFIERGDPDFSTAKSYRYLLSTVLPFSSLVESRFLISVREHWQ